jgi:hypothetical protein
MTRARIAVAAFVVVLTGTLVYGVLAGWKHNAEVVLAVIGVVGYVWIIVTDSVLRGRSGAGWLLACIFLAPLALPVFAFVAVRDRLRGRRGIESYWAPGVRWCYLAAVGMAAVALCLALTQFSAAKPYLGQNPTITGFSGSCQAPAIDLVLGKRPPGVDFFYDGQPAAQRAELDRFAQRCQAKAGRRMVASEVSLAGGLALALIGGINQRRRRPVSPPPASVTLAA